jgi:hypothetical protein
MSAVVAAASPLELAALWRLDLLTARDVVQVCLAWLEQGLDDQAPDIAVLAGEIDPRLAEVGPSFERVLTALAGPLPSRDQALPIALRLHLAVALVQPDARLAEAINLVIAHFASVSDVRLVVHPRRLTDRPDETYAQQELGLEYVYGAYFELDDFLDDRARFEALGVTEAECLSALRQEATALHAHLAGL